MELSSVVGTYEYIEEILHAFGMSESLDESKGDLRYSVDILVGDRPVIHTFKINDYHSVADVVDRVFIHFVSKFNDIGFYRAPYQKVLTLVLADTKNEYPVYVNTGIIAATKEPF